MITTSEYISERVEMEKGSWFTKRYKSAVASVIKADLINIKMDNEISDKLSNKLVTVISTLIGTQVTAAYASVDAATVITQGDINTHKLEDIDATHQLQ